MNRPLNILFIHDYPHAEGGGVEVQTFQDARALASLGHSVTIATTRTVSETFTTDAHVRYPHIVAPRLCLEKASTEADIVQLMRCADVIHVQATFSLRDGMMTALRCADRCGARLVVSLRTTVRHIPFSRIGKLPLIMRQALLDEFCAHLRNSRCIISGPSSAVQASLDELGILRRVHVIHNAKDWDELDTQALHGPVIPRVAITYAGELSHMKGVDVLMRALVKLKRVLSPRSVRVIGAGQDERKLLALAQKLGVGSLLRFEGYISHDRMPAFLRATDVLAVPSRTESWCNVAMEALGLGTPVVASDIEGLAELLDGGRRGLLFPLGDAHALAIALEKVLYSRVIRARLTAPHISREVRTTYCIKKRITELLSFYDTIGAQHYTENINPQVRVGSLV
ncbi:MAG: glycosyltransferase family 4 protein [Candidatus Paceibacterota bacterium]|nr:MAG: glycosyltransferase family 4 protein [Candidatus Paceibacterota bacterium]